MSQNKNLRVGNSLSTDLIYFLSRGGGGLCIQIMGIVRKNDDGS